MEKSGDNRVKADPALAITKSRNSRLLKNVFEQANLFMLQTNATLVLIVDDRFLLIVCILSLIVPLDFSPLEMHSFVPQFKPEVAAVCHLHTHSMRTIYLVFKLRNFFLLKYNALSNLFRNLIENQYLQTCTRLATTENNRNAGRERFFDLRFLFGFYSTSQLENNERTRVLCIIVSKAYIDNTTNLNF